MKICRLTILLFIACIPCGLAQQPILLYPDGVPNSKKTPVSYVEVNENNKVGFVSIPTLTPFFPEKTKANGTAVIICPGGGYARLMVENEGYEIARRFNEMGIAAFVLKYRLPSDEVMVDKTIGPLQDAQRAIQLIRLRASEWGINPAKVGIIGFSAGGHLASTAGTHFGHPVIENKLNVSLRPDFMMLIYPVVSFGEVGHQGSKHNLLGLSPDQKLVDWYSNEKQVDSNTPMTFIVQAQDDKTVAVQNSLLFYSALTAAKVKADMVLYGTGGHGFGLYNKTTKDQWFDHVIHWLDDNGFLQSF
ncbi:alpha/beta hydrolase [Pedobacter sp. MC2016-24]|uniref:alpha/beta hydrolase n=1 Tax=Pedobacter sp. MC2016-24 TaxID=2780090 RepID=UPI00187FB67C|nr:alpha/beta hydrolase [Pedobacter sp. MC2016-24]MBE9602883.1 alpha/beta hydrolase [Pedobacter sp. MC2016-24]